MRAGLVYSSSLHPCMSHIKPTEHVHSSHAFDRIPPTKHTMQASDGSSPGARSALLAMADNLQLHPIIIARALEYAFDNISSFPTTEQALCFGIVRQGHYVDMQVLDLALHRLRTDYGGVFHVPVVHNGALGHWKGHGQSPYAAVNARRQAGNSDASTSSHNSRVQEGGGYQNTSVLSALPRIGSWPMPQSRRPNSRTPVANSLVGPRGVAERRPAGHFGAV
ncbi:hypothetical protein C7974DRAFT_173629 [Boeremia exigua]|uniref:uncharacterized protein n=1 Tax=Boeremia exigua TaxID=749465 RepID=UPI001E8DD299|nr:uncharacterized protein C7974DRAFT_173629 [Boeremia exigua]KAH6633524.1 hypothetical protein C7974DRAFT_173629 [Boeremia exigua]